jgi:hypothetical protein
MDIHKTLEDLREQHKYINHAIAALENFAGQQPRRGRPPKRLSNAGKKSVSGSSRALDWSTQTQPAKESNEASAAD